MRCLHAALAGAEHRTLVDTPRNESRDMNVYMAFTIRLFLPRFPHFCN